MAKTKKQPTQVFVNKTYKLTRDAAPLCFMLSSKHTKRKPVWYFDDKEGINKPLRYARNQKTPFEDDQDGNAILEPIIFEDGFLVVRKENQVLQKFLHYHPENGATFVEVNNEKDASKDLEIIHHEVDALVAAREMDITRAEQIGRVGIGMNTDKMTSAEIKRDVLVYARNNPQEFLDLLNDPMLELQSKVNGYFRDSMLSWKNNKDVYFNTKTNKKKMLTVPFGESRDYIVASFLQSDEGIETLKMLENRTESLAEA